MANKRMNGGESPTPLRGAIPIIEAQRPHTAFLSAAQPQRAMVSITTAQRLLRRGETASSYLGEDTTTIVTTSVSDEALDELSLTDELQVIDAFAPDYYLPADVATYTDDSPAQRVERIRECVTGTTWIAEAIADRGLSTRLIPFVKGVTPVERAICYEAIVPATGPVVEQCAFYAGQYFTGGDGIQTDRVVEDVTALDDELAERGLSHEILVVGMLAPPTLKRLPDRVTAAAGLQTWRSEVEPRGRSEAEIRQRYRILERIIDRALGVGTGADTGSGDDGTNSRVEERDEKRPESREEEVDGSGA